MQCSFVDLFYLKLHNAFFLSTISIFLLKVSGEDMIQSEAKITSFFVPDEGEYSDIIDIKIDEMKDSPLVRINSQHNNNYYYNSKFLNTRSSIWPMFP